MSTSNLIELLGLVLGGGGGATVVSKLTRLAVAVEQLVESQRKVTDTVQGHETRISTLEGQQHARP